MNWKFWKRNKTQEQEETSSLPRYWWWEDDKKVYSTEPPPVTEKYEYAEATACQTADLHINPVGANVCKQCGHDTAPCAVKSVLVCQRGYGVGADYYAAYKNHFFKSAEVVRFL
jgi:hypothetical protein